jgi:hypothetical protein
VADDAIRRTLCAALVLLPVAAAQAAPAFHIEIADTAAYRVTHDELAALVPDLGELPSERLTLSVRGEPRRLYVEDGGDRRFGPGDAVTFYGERLHGKQSWFDTYAVNNVYRLAVAEGPVAPAPSATTSDAAATVAADGPTLRRRVHLEEENLQIRLSNRYVQPHEEPDLWHWAKLTQIDPEPFRVPFGLPDLSAEGTVNIELMFRGLSNVRMPHGTDKADKPVDHVVEVMLGEETIATARFEDREEHRLSVQLPAARLAQRGGELSLRVPQRMLPGATDALVDVVMFDFVAFDYPIEGKLGPTPLPIHVAAAGDAGADVALSAQAQSLALYGADGTRRVGARDGDTWRFTGVASGDYQPVPDGRYAAPAKLRTEKPARWRDVEEGYDYLLIGHSTLLPEAAPLAQHHRRSGLRVAEVDVDALYDEFNHGIVHPKAIRDFIAHAYHEWPAPRPRFVLLVGDASFDVRSERAEDTRYAKWVNRELLQPGGFGVIPGGRYAEGSKVAAQRNLIPTWQYPSEEGHSAADNYFVAVDGDDWLPDLAIGRFPVVEPSEVAAIVDKTIRYANSTDFGDWRRRALFTTDTSTYFQRESTRLAEVLDEEGFSTTEVYANKEETDNELQINSLNDALNEGQLLVHFIGHGGRYIWRTGPPDFQRNHDLFTLDHVAQLQNGDRLPMVLSMTCYSAPFDHPDADSIGERFLREADKGAIAVFAASWRNSPTPQFSEAAVTELMTPGATIGEALMRAKQTLTNKWHRTLVETYNLLGDPAVVLQRPSLPVQLQARTGGGAERLDVRIDQDRGVNGRVTIEWRASDGSVVASTAREMRGRHASVLVPAAGADAAEVHVHVTDYAGRRDGIARLILASEDDPGTGHSDNGGTTPDAVASAAGEQPDATPPTAQAARHADGISRGIMDGQ